MAGRVVAKTNCSSIIVGGMGLEPIFIFPLFPKSFISLPVFALRAISSSKLVKNNFKILFFLSFQIRIY